MRKSSRWDFSKLLRDARTSYIGIPRTPCELHSTGVSNDGLYDDSIEYR